MQENKLNNIIFLKDVESNIIEEAIIIFKDGVCLKQIDDKNSSESKLQEINILKEAEMLINKEIEKNNIEYDKFIIRKLKKKLKFLKVTSTLLVFICMLLIKIF